VKALGCTGSARHDVGRELFAAMMDRIVTLPRAGLARQ